MIFDLHNDFPTVFQKDAERIAKMYARYGTITAVVWTSELDPLIANIFINDISSSLTCPIAVEDLGFLTDAMIEEFRFDKLCYCSMTWNVNNRFAGGALDDGGLTKDGVRLIDRINAACALDLAHLNKRSFYSALDLAKNPICSHTGFSAHPRCLDGQAVKALSSRHGIIGLSAVTAFTGATTACKLAEVIDEFVQNFGIETLCIGTDFNGTVDLPKDFKNYNDLQRLQSALSCLGYSAADINKIFYKNAYDYFKELQSEKHL